MRREKVDRLKEMAYRTKPVALEYFLTPFSLIAVGGIMK